MGEWKGTTRAWNIRLKPSDLPVHPSVDGLECIGMVASADSAGLGGPTRGAETEVERLNTKKAEKSFVECQ
jgi:hypothetical protein